MKILITKLDKMFSEIIRKRAMRRVKGCERCLKPKKSYKDLQTAHMFTRGTRNTRWDEDNAVGVCGGCHMYLDSHPDEKIMLFKKLLSQKRYDFLNIRAHIVGAKIDLSVVELYLKQKLEEV